MTGNATAVLLAAAALCAGATQGATADESLGADGPLGPIEGAFDTSSSRFDAALDARVLGTLSLPPAAHTGHAVRAAPSLPGISPLSRPRRGRLARPGAEDCPAGTAPAPADGYWEARARVPVPAAPPAWTPVGPATGEGPVPHSARTWCEPRAAPPGPLEPLGRALWGPLLVVVLGTLAFWATRGFRSP